MRIGLAFEKFDERLVMRRVFRGRYPKTSWAFLALVLRQEPTALPPTPSNSHAGICRNDIAQSFQTRFATLPAAQSYGLSLGYSEGDIPPDNSREASASPSEL